MDFIFNNDSIKKYFTQSFLAPTGALGEGILSVRDIIQKNSENEF